jgi:hypothetical protein
MALLWIDIPAGNDRSHIGRSATITRLSVRTRIKASSFFAGSPSFSKDLRCYQERNNVDDVTQTCVRHDGQEGRYLVNS